MLILGAWGSLWIAAIMWRETKEKSEYRRWMQLHILGKICMALMFISILFKFDGNIAIGFIIGAIVLDHIAGMIGRRRFHRRQSEEEASSLEAASSEDHKQ